MNYKKLLLNSISIFIISTLLHFLYSTFPCFLTSIIAPVNESIWEHLKLIFISSTFFTIIDLSILKEKNIFLKSYLKAIFNIIILLVLYLPIRIFFQENLITTLIIFFLSILISEVLFSYISKKENTHLNILSIFFILISIVLFTYLSYYPLKNFLFYDTQTNSYGIFK